MRLQKLMGRWLLRAKSNGDNTLGYRESSDHRRSPQRASRLPGPAIERRLEQRNREACMRRSQPPTSRGVLEVDWPFFGELCRALALRVARDYEPEIVLGIAKAGVIPGVVVASILQSEFTSMAVTRREAGAQPVLVSGPPPTIRGRRVLVVDETCDTGSTMKLALSEIRALHPEEVRTAVSFKTGDYAPDYHAFETENFIILPWDREIIQGGELVMRPDYAARL